MQLKLESKITVAPRMCDCSGRLGLADAIDIFMDMATQHANIIGMGRQNMASPSFFWVAVRTKVCFTRHPKMSEELTAKTVLGRTDRLKSIRHYYLEGIDGHAVAEGKTEWSIIDTQTGRPQIIKSCFDTDISPDEVNDGGRPFERIRPDLSSAEKIAEHRVSSGDIDFVSHMNNVAYVRLLLSTMSVSELQNITIKEFDVSYLSQCYENEHLSVFRKGCDGIFHYFIVKEDGSIATAARLVAEHD